MKAGEGLLTRGDVDQSQNTTMGSAANDSQFTEVLIQRNKNPALSMGVGQDYLIAGSSGQSPVQTTS